MKYSILSAFLLSLVLTAVGYAQVDPTTAAVDKIFSWSKPDEPGCSAAVMKDGKLVVERAYGSADLERSVPISNNTRFDAGSIRKQFVATGILQLVEEGKLSLTDDIRKHIPELPDYGNKITLDHLLTHTSGIRDWQPLLNLAGGDPDAMTMILRQRELNFTPGEEWSYSNSGYVLLPEVIRRVSGMPFSEFAQKRIFEPLGMKNSVYADDPDTLIPHRALAYDIEKGSWKLDMYSGNDRGGAGALFTTAADLALWNDALMNGRLGAYVSQKLVEPTVLNSGRKLSYTRGLFVELNPGRGGQLVWHTGGAAGYSARAGYLADHKLIVVTMCNRDGGSKAEYASRLFDMFLPPEEEPKAPEAAPVATGDLKPLAGAYVDEKNGQLLQVVVNNNGVLGIAGGGPLVAIAERHFRVPRKSLFFMSEAEVEIRFLSDGHFELKTADGPVRHFHRAKPWSPSEDDLKRYIGRFYSDELMATFEATPAKDGLSVRLNDSPKAVTTFRPAGEGVFQAGMSILRFVRDGEGNVVRLEYSNPLLRKVKFVRAAEVGTR